MQDPLCIARDYPQQVAFPVEDTTPTGSAVYRGRGQQHRGLHVVGMHHLHAMSRNCGQQRHGCMLSACTTYVPAKEACEWPSLHVACWLAEATIRCVEVTISIAEAAINSEQAAISKGYYKH